MNRSTQTHSKPNCEHSSSQRKTSCVPQFFNTFAHLMYLVISHFYGSLYREQWEVHIWLYLFLGIWPLFLCMRGKWSQNCKKEGVRKSGKKNRIEKKDNQTIAWGQQYELGRRRHPPSVSHTAVPQLVMLWLGQRAGSWWDCSKVTAVTNWCACSPGISVETCPQEQQGGRKASRGKKADGDGVGDRRLNFGLWLVGMRRHQEKEK